MAPGIKFSLGNLIANTEINHLLSPRESSSCDFFVFYFCLKQCVCVLFVIRTSCWLSWMSCSRRRWRGACWRSEDQRMSTSPTCLQLRYPPEAVRVWQHPSHFLCICGYGVVGLFFIFSWVVMYCRELAAVHLAILVYIPSKKGVSFS